MKTIAKVKVTRSGYVHLLDAEGKVIIKLKSGDALYTDDHGNFFVARKDSIEYLNGEIHFDSNLPVCKDNLNDDGWWLELMMSRYVVLVAKPAMFFTSRYEQYSVTANVIIAK